MRGRGLTVDGNLISDGRGAGAGIGDHSAGAGQEGGGEDRETHLDGFVWGWVFVEEVKIEGVSEDDAEEQW
jgi:hypothetical protein